VALDAIQRRAIDEVVRAPTRFGVGDANNPRDARVRSECPASKAASPMNSGELATRAR